MSRPVRTCCLWVPDWPAVAARRDPALVGIPVAVVEQGAHGLVVRAASAEARACDVVPGLYRREAEARCPGLVVVEADPMGETRAFEAVARAIEALTPRLVLETPGRLAFPTRGPSRYFGGDVALAARVRDAAISVGVDDARVGVADGMFAAWLAARSATDDSGRVHVVPAGATLGFLASWPVRVLGDPDLASLLSRLGLRTLGAFAALPAGDVLARFGAAGARAHRMAATGDDGEPDALTVPPPELVAVHEFDPPEPRADAAAFAAKVLADGFLARLAERGVACTRVGVEVETEHGERSTRVWRHDGPLTTVALADRVRWQLDAWLAANAEGANAEAATGGLTLVRLMPDELVPAGGGRQLGFWGGDTASADRAGRAFARVQAMLGPGEVVLPVAQGGRTSGERVRWVPWGEPLEPATRGPARWPGALPGPAPARVFDTPLPAALLDATGTPVTVSGRGEASATPAVLRCGALPRGGGRVTAWAGPWAHDVRWWDRLTRRRRALWQVVVGDGDGDGEVACLVVLERGAAALEAIYD